MTKETEIKSRSDMLARERVSRLLWKLSIPAIIGMLVHGLYNIVDTFFVGRFAGTLAIGGISIAFPVQMIIMGIGMTIGIGGASVLSRRMGERDKEGASLALGNMILLSLAVGVLGLIFGILFMDPLLRLFGANDALMPFAGDYLLIVLIGSPMFDKTEQKKFYVAGDFDRYQTDDIKKLIEEGEPVRIARIASPRECDVHGHDSLLVETWIQFLQVLDRSDHQPGAGE